MGEFKCAASNFAEHWLINVAAVLFGPSSLPSRFPIKNAIEQLWAYSAKEARVGYFFVGHGREYLTLAPMALTLGGSPNFPSFPRKRDPYH